MTGIRVKTSPFTAKRQVRVLHFAFHASQLINLQLFYPDVIAAIQEDVLRQLTKLSTIINVAGSAIGSVGRSMKL